jgi:hypothetical protein
MIGVSVALRPRGAKVVETFTRKGRADNPSGPVGFYLSMGPGHTLTMRTSRFCIWI